MYRRFIMTCFIAGGLAVATSVMAQESKPAKPNASSTTSTASNQNQQNAKKKIDAQIEKLSKQVDLTSDQKDQLRAQLQKDHGKTQKLWKQFADAHVQVIRQEAEMLAALEDVMEPDQKQKAQQNRHAKAHTNSDASAQHADANKDQHNTGQANTDQASKDKLNADKSTKSGDSDSKAKADASTTVKSGQHGEKDGDKGAADKSHTAASSDKQRQTEEYVWTMVIIPAQVELEPLGLSNEQEQQCDQVCRNYHRSLVQGWQQIDQLHDQLVAIEAQQILDVEKILTDAQRQKLMNARQDSNKKDSTSDSKSKS